MILTVAYILAAALTAIALNPFLVVGLVIADLIAFFLLVVLLAAYWQKETAQDFSDNLFDGGGEDSPWTEDDVEEFMSGFGNNNE